jgi:hypothetical protein
MYVFHAVICAVTGEIALRVAVRLDKLEKYAARPDTMPVAES